MINPKMNYDKLPQEVELGFCKTWNRREPKGLYKDNKIKLLKPQSRSKSRESTIRESIANSHNQIDQLSP